MELEEKKFLAYSGANGSLCRLRHRLLHVMLDFTMNFLTLFISRLVSNSWECLLCNWKFHALFFSIASIILWYMFSCKCFNWVTWRMLAPSYDYSLVTLVLYERLVFDLLYHFMLWSICFVAMHDYGYYALLVGRIPVFC